MNFNNQVVWITGASSGLDEAMAKAFKVIWGKLCCKNTTPISSWIIKHGLKNGGQVIQFCRVERVFLQPMFSQAVCRIRLICNP